MRTFVEMLEMVETQSPDNENREVAGGSAKVSMGKREKCRQTFPSHRSGENGSGLASTENYIYYIYSIVNR